MKVKDIIKQVRYCIDEEKYQSDFVDDFMDNIIRAKINDALRWVCLYSDARLLGGADSTTANNPTIRSYTLENTPEPEEGTVETYPVMHDGVITLPYDFLRLLRVRVEGWRKAVSKTVTEDSDVYLEQTDVTAKADISTPVVAIIEDYPNKLELYPKPESGKKVYLTISVEPSEYTISTTSSDESEVAIPPKVKTAFLYYIAYLVMVAYNDSNRAALMLGVAKTHVGGSTTETDAG